MNIEINQVIKDILNRHQNQTSIAIQQMFKLFTGRPKEDHASIQKAILFSMQNIHEWQNILKYSQRWNMEDYRKDLTIRMKKRLYLNNHDATCSNSKQELSRLIHLYQQIMGTNKTENTYQEVFSHNISNEEKQSKDHKNKHEWKSCERPLKAYPKIDLSKIIKKNKLENEINEVKVINKEKNQVKQVSLKEQLKPISSQRLCKIIKNQQKIEPNPQNNKNPPFKFDSNKKSDRKISKSKLVNSTKYDPTEVNAKLYSFSKSNMSSQQNPLESINNKTKKPLVVKKLEYNPTLEIHNFDSFEKKSKQQKIEIEQYETRLLIRQVSKQLKQEKESKQSNQQFQLRQSSSKKQRSLRESFYAFSTQNVDLYVNLKKIDEEMKSKRMNFFINSFQ